MTVRNLLVHCVIAASAAALHAAAPQFQRLRPAAAESKALLDEALRTSRIIQTLASEITASDLIVYVELSSLVDPGEGRTQFVTVAGTNRFLRVTVGARTPRWDRVPLLAHELQHVVEIARQPLVRDQDSLRAYYQLIGDDPAADVDFETAEARRIEIEVRKEYSRGRRSGGR